MKVSKRGILESLSKLDLSTYPIEEIHKLIQQLGQYGVIVTTFHPGTVIVRARPNPNSNSFNKVSDLSYKPSEYNSTYQRASTPNETMFYGAVLPFDNNKLDFTRAVGLSEVSCLMRNKIIEGEERITFGKWIVIQDIHVASIVHNSDYLEQNPDLKQMHDDYSDFINTHPGLAEDSLMISEFFAKQFAKSEISKDYDYLLSAIYTERFSQIAPQISGVLYPSVRTDGKGFNVALRPKCVDNSLELRGVVECIMYKKGENIIVDNSKIALLNENQKTFFLEPIIDPKECFGPEKVYELMKSYTGKD